eukprot:jgi/Hompol1/6370/HPOL_001186-RA
MLPLPVAPSAAGAAGAGAPAPAPDSAIDSLNPMRSNLAARRLSFPMPAGSVTHNFDSASNPDVAVVAASTLNLRQQLDRTTSTSAATATATVQHPASSNSHRFSTSSTISAISAISVANTLSSLASVDSSDIHSSVAISRNSIFVPTQLPPAKDPTVPKRQKVAEEILETEKRYCDSLQLLDEELISKRHLHEIFSNLKDIIGVNTELKNQLEERIQGSPFNVSKTCIGDIFLVLTPYLKMYSLYVKNFNHAISLITELTHKHPAFAAFLKEQAMRRECKGLIFQTLLIEPVQRIPRYKLLLDDLLKCTPSTHPDYTKLVKALGLVSQVAIFVNEEIRKHENVLRMVEIQKSLIGLHESLLVPGRRFIHRGRVQKSMFSPTVLDDQFLFHRKLSLEHCRIDDLPDTLDDAANGASSYVAPVWVPDSLAMQCHSCRDSFTMLNRRSFYIPYGEREQLVRCCDGCFATIAKEQKYRIYVPDELPAVLRNHIHQASQPDSVIETDPGTPSHPQDTHAARQPLNSTAVAAADKISRSIVVRPQGGGWSVVIPDEPVFE